MTLVIFELKIFKNKVKNILSIRNMHLREYKRRARKLRTHLFKMIAIYMPISQRMDKFSRLQSGYFSNHQNQKGIGSNIERYS